MGEQLLCWLLNSLCCALYGPAARRLRQIDDLEAQQRQKLLALVAANRNTAFGRAHGFDTIATVADYQRQVPLRTYDDYLPWIEALLAGEQNGLTAERVLLFEPTSGSVSASKYIPYTAGLRREFQAGLKPWLHDLYTRYPEIRRGKSYWSVTPVTARGRYSPGGTPIGFEEDSQYFGFLERWIFDRVFAVPAAAVKGGSLEDFWFNTALRLLACESLTLISVWNPTFLLLILDTLEKRESELLAALKARSPRRHGQVAPLLAAGAYTAIWPRLALISCWGDGNAAVILPELRRRFPGVRLQPKGLLATEAFVTLPCGEEAGALLAAESHFFEFLSPGEGRVCLAHQLKAGETYEVVVTTAGGLYRYALKDRVRVEGHTGCLPRLSFQGKAELVSDLFGEKLSEGFLRQVMAAVAPPPEFYLFAPEGDHYVLYFKGSAVPAIEGALRQNFHYDYCLQLGQLKPLRLFRLTGDPRREYLEGCAARGQRLGDVKPAVLSLQGGWDRVFKGEYL